MATTNEGKRQIAGTAQSIVLGIAMVAGLFVLGQALVDAVSIRQKEQRITVTGSATRRIRSDFIVWEARVRSQDPTLTAAYKKLSTDVPVLVEFIKARGIKETDIAVHSTSVREVYPRNEHGIERQEMVAAYVTEQVVKVKSAEIAKVEQVSREVTQLIDRDIYVHSEAPLYIYTKLAELKIKMLAEASADAKLRAEQIANNTGARLGELLNARMGVLQVNPEFSTEVSWDGNNDKTTLDKDVLAIVTASFGVR